MDEYRIGSVARLNPEAPVPILNVEHSEERLGMAYNVMANLKAFGVRVSQNFPRNFSRKIRYLDSRTGYHLLRVDEDQVPSRPFSVEQIADYERYDAVVVSDYNKGYIQESLFSELHDRFSGPIFVDTKKTNLPELDRVIYKINETEFSALTSKVNPQNLVVTLGERGCQYNNRLYVTGKVNVVDVCGAGDVFLAALTYGYLKTQSMDQAIQLANDCATLSCQHLGSYTLTKQDIKCVS